MQAAEWQLSGHVLILASPRADEVSICRVTDSAFGPANVILENCESAGTENYVMEDGPSDTCTGAGSATAPASLVTVAAALVAVAAMASL